MAKRHSNFVSAQDVSFWCDLFIWCLELCFCPIGVFFLCDLLFGVWNFGWTREVGMWPDG